MQHAAIYLRSSKDRSDISIASQRRELKEYAERENITIVTEYGDAVESGKTEHRPGFQRLLTDLRAPDRPWNTLLATDTSRISRRTYFAHAMRHECQKRGVEIRYTKLPQDLDPITEVIVHSTLTAMDEVHSLMSRQKGLAGMAENVRNGWRAGGRAPYGYQLQYHGTGTQRDGQEVTKTTLALDPNAATVKRYLTGRANGETRRQACAASGIKKATSTLVGIEWNALTYAGATVWNVNAEKLPEGGYKGGHKRRPRDEWLIQRDTHKPLITWQQAETLIQRLEDSDIGKAVSQAKTGNSNYLLTGLLTAPDGTKWWGESHKYYRYKGTGKQDSKYVRIEHVDDAVLQRISHDMQSPDLVRALTQAARKQATAEDPTTDLRAEVIRINEQISKTMDLAAQLADPAPALRKIDQLETDRRQATEQVAKLEREYTAQRTLRNVTEASVRKTLNDIWEITDEDDTPRIKAALRNFIEKIELNPQTLEAKVVYRIAADHRVSMASPRVAAICPTMRHAVAFMLPRAG